MRNGRHSVGPGASGARLDPEAGVLAADGAGAPPIHAARAALLLDVDCSGRRRLARDLESRSYAVFESDDADEGAALALRVRPDLLVLELRLRVGSGLDVLARLRPRLAASRFVVLTSYGSAASAVRAMRLGATNYLCKPVVVADVLRAAEEPGAEDAFDDPGVSATLTLDQAIWEYIHQTLETAGSLSEAARRLGLWRQSLKRMIAKYRPAGPAPAAPHLVR